MKRITLLAFSTLLLLGGPLYGVDQLIVHPGKYADDKVGVTLLIDTPDAAHIRFKISYQPDSKTDHEGRSVLQRVTLGEPEPLAVRPDRWAFYIEAPNLIWFYDGIERLTLWTVTSERGLSWVDSTIVHMSNGPEELYAWIRKPRKEPNQSSQPPQAAGPRG